VLPRCGGNPLVPTQGLKSSGFALAVYGGKDPLFNRSPRLRRRGEQQNNQE
jgi:hypothetical protein